MHKPDILTLQRQAIFVLLIACANIANLLLARTSGRAGEFAVRNALGASQSRIVRQLLTESLIISVIGGSGGVLLAVWGCKGLAALAPPFLLKSTPGLAGDLANPLVLSFALVTILVTTFLFGLAPALQRARVPAVDALKEVGRSTTQQGPWSHRFRSALVVFEIALAMVLLVGAGLMARTLAELSSVNLGFNPYHVLTLRVPLSGDRYKQPQARAEFYEHLVAAVRTLPGVESVSVSRGVPIGDWAGQFFVTSNLANPPAGQVPDANYVIAGPDYFRTLQIPLRRGRSFEEGDTQSAQRVVIVNEELARLYWPGENPIGKQLRVGPPPAPWLSVVGVVGNVLSQGPDAGFHAEIYIPYQQFPWLLGGPQHLLVRTSARIKPESLVPAVVREVHRADKGQPVTDITTLEEVAAEPLAQQRMVMVLLVSFAGLALVLSVLGIYSVLSYAVAQQSREIGIRIALGAQRKDVYHLVFRRGMALVAAGVAIGLGVTIAVTRLLATFLFQVTSHDPTTIAGVILLFTVVAMLACYLPARRAMRVDPMVTVKYE